VDIMPSKKPHEELTIGYLVFQLVAFSLFISVPVGGGLYFFLENYAELSEELSDAAERLSLSEDDIGFLIAFFGVVLIWIVTVVFYCWHQFNTIMAIRAIRQRRLGLIPDELTKYEQWWIKLKNTRHRRRRY
jgi:hypothetical protein